ncbi:MAG: lipoprotein-releasing system ATP-binding protein LolD [Candidatus Tectimicrobiota bacterium]|nr:MAG: lipoprotein-releasing system ATP-binding protein LolD [Candidatus Tectomicrobia bacterium]
MLIEAEDVHKHFVLHKTRVDVLRGVSLQVAAGEMVAILGPSGAGKSTLLHLLGGLDRPSRGTIRFGGVDLFQLSDEELADFRNRRIGFVFQFHHLLPEFSALENTMMPALIQRRPRHEALHAARQLLTNVGLGDRLHHRPGELSGGEQQRVAVARALINRPDVVIADEPTGNLDRATGQAMQKLLRRLNEELGQTFVIATHDQEFAAHMDRAIVLVDGQVSAA